MRAAAHRPPTAEHWSRRPPATPDAPEEVGRADASQVDLAVTEATREIDLLPDGEVAGGEGTLLS